MANQVRDARTPGFWITDNELIEVHGATIGVYGLAVYGALAMYAGQGGRCDPSVATVAEKIGASVRQVRATISKLVEHGLIAVEHRKGEDGKTNGTNLYTILQVAKLDKYTGRDTARDAAGVRHEVPKGTAGRAGGVRQDVPGGTAGRAYKQDRPTRTKKQEEDAAAGAATPPGAYGDLFVAICDACRIDPAIISPADARNVSALAKRYDKANVTAADVAAAAGRWTAEDWRGKQGQAPTVGQFASWLSTCRKAAPVPPRPGTQPAVPTWTPASAEDMAASRAKHEAWKAEIRRKQGLDALGVGT